MSSKTKNTSILIAIMIGYSIIYMDKQLISLAMVPIASELSLTSSQVGDIMAFYFIGYSVMQIPSGFIADKIGPKKVLLMSLIIALITSIAFSALSIIAILIALRLVIGVGHAGYPPSAAKTISLNFEPNKRVFAQSMILSTSGIGGILAAVVGGAVLASSNWRVLYIILAVLYILAFIIVMFVVPNKKDTNDDMQHEKISLKTVLKDRNVYTLFIGLLAINIVIYGVLSWIPTYLTKELDVSTSTIALVLGVNAIIVLITTITTGLGLSKGLKGREKPFVLITTLIAAILLPLFVMMKSPTFAIIIIFVLTIMAAASFTTLFTIPHKIFEHKVMGLAFGFVSTGGTLGGFVANKVIGTLVESSNSYMSSFVFMSVAAIVCGISTLLIKKRVLND